MGSHQGMERRRAAQRRVTTVDATPGRSALAAPGHVRSRYPLPMASKRNAALDAMIEDATVDAYGDDEQLTGLFAMIEEHLAVPFTTIVLGVEVTVRKVDLGADAIVAVCAGGGHRQRIDLLDLPLPAPPPDGAAWIDAYRHWAGR